MIEQAALIAQAREWLGVRFLHQGRSRNGADCLGFISALLAELGSPTFMDFLPLNYSRRPDTLLIESLPQLTREIPQQPCALVVFQFPMSKLPSHGGILLEGTSFIHCDQMSGGVREVTFGGMWPERARSFWALPGVCYP